MKAEDVAWLVLMAVAAASFVGMCLLGGCRVYEPPCPCRESQAGGVSVQLLELADDGGCE